MLPSGPGQTSHPGPGVRRRDFSEFTGPVVHYPAHFRSCQDRKKESRRSPLIRLIDVAWLTGGLLCPVGYFVFSRGRASIFPCVYITVPKTLGLITLMSSSVLPLCSAAADKPSDSWTCYIKPDFLDQVQLTQQDLKKHDRTGFGPSTRLDINFG